MNSADPVRTRYHVKFVSEISVYKSKIYYIVAGFRNVKGKRNNFLIDPENGAILKNQQYST